MFDFVPLADYTNYFHYAVLALLLIVLAQCFRGSVFSRLTAYSNAGWGAIVLVALVLYMGLRPVSGWMFGDMAVYAADFSRLAATNGPMKWHFEGEWFFSNMTRLLAKLVDVHGYFLICAAVYVGSLWLAMVRMFRSYYYVPFLVVIFMFTFWNYGTNGIRNGMGASLFILAMTYVENLPVAILLCLAATGIHQSIWLVVGAAVLANFVKNSYYYLAAWVLCVIVSYFVGETIQASIAGMSIFGGYDRFTDYLTVSNINTKEVVMEIGFRWDFLLYSAMAVVTGWYFIFKKNFEDEYYHWMYNAFLVTNAVWVLVIRASYSNRLAQISWFILPLVLIYPFMKKRFWENQEKVLGYALMAFYAFTFFYNILKPLIF